MDYSNLPAWGLSDTGRKRSNNEDAFLLDAPRGVFVVCDGMGGHAAGERASAEAVRAIHRHLVSRADTLDGASAGSGARCPMRVALQQAVEVASAQVFDLGRQDLRLRGMGTTASALVIRGERAYIGHVGDSRIYLLRGGQIHQLTDDHTVLAELLRNNESIDAETLERFPYRHSLSRAVGNQSTVQVDTMDMEVLPGDHFLLCSDGLHGYVGDGAVLADLITGGPMAEAPSRLVAFANEQGGKDNITALLVRVPDAVQPEVQDTLVEQHRFSVATLRAIRLFQHLDFKELLGVLNLAETRSYSRGQRVIAEGEAGSAFYIITSGQAVVAKGSVEVARLKAGDHFGEMALVDRVPRSATVTALGPLQCQVIDRAPLYGVLRSSPQLANKILWNFVQVLSARLRGTSAELEQLRAVLAESGQIPDTAQHPRQEP